MDQLFRDTDAISHMLGLYELVSYLIVRNTAIFSLSPALVVVCGRNDLGMMRAISEVWASDNTDAIASFHHTVWIILSLSNHFPINSCVSSNSRIIRWDE